MIVHVIAKIAEKLTILSKIVKNKEFAKNVLTSSTYKILFHFLENIRYH